ncbi:MAG TPA: nitric oxide reductase activation protein NorD, partial [Pseudomonas sp.]|nr:nitric oxide reductase activation protein NorD [Pseudomonas sp.]
MAFSIEVEEWVGSVWHRFITRRSDPDFTHAQVQLSDQQRALALLFHAIGGASAVQIQAAQPRELLLRRGLLQQVAGTCRQMPVAWRDAQNMRLPSTLAVFPQAELNRELYRWLAMLGAVADGMRHWGRDNQRWVNELLQRYPAMRPRYQRLVDAHLRLRPAPDSLPAASAALERDLRQALREPGSVTHFAHDERAPWPLPLWLYPPQGQGPGASSELPEEGEGSARNPNPAQRSLRKRASRIDDSSGKGGLLLFRLENLFSWSEHVQLDRCNDDSEDLDAARVAEDLDELTLSRQRTRKGGGLHLDLDLPSPEQDDVPLGPGLHLPEWDYRRSALLERHVSLQLFHPHAAEAQPLPTHLALPARRLRRQFEVLRNDRQWLRQQPQGSELDLSAWLDFQVQRQQGKACEKGLFLEQRSTRRQLACLLLADLSMSTES